MIVPSCEFYKHNDYTENYRTNNTYSLLAVSQARASKFFQNVRRTRGCGGAIALPPLLLGQHKDIPSALLLQDVSQVTEYVVVHPSAFPQPTLEKVATHVGLPV